MIRKSPWISVCESGSCNGCLIEVLTLFTPKYDIERFGCVWRPSARDTDILIVTGTATRQSKSRLRRVYMQMASEKRVLAVGNCTISGCVFRESYNTTDGVEKIIPVDMYVPGCPPRPEAIIDGLLKLLSEMNGRKKS